MLNIKQVDIAIITTCNFTCKYCRGNPGKRNRMPLNEVINIINNFKDISDIKKIRLDGGEPFLYGEEIFKIIEHNQKNDIETGIFTNASLIGKTISAQRIKDYENLKLIVTLHTINNSSELNTTINGLHALAEKNILPELIIIVSKKHIEFIAETLKHIPKRYYKVTFRPMIPIGKAFENWKEGFHALNKKETENFLSLIDNLKNKFQNLVFHNSLPNEEIYNGYHSKNNSYTLHINTDGILLPSFAASTEDYLGSAINKIALIKKMSDPNILDYLKKADTAIVNRIKIKEKPKTQNVIVNKINQ